MGAIGPRSRTMSHMRVIEMAFRRRRRGGRGRRRFGVARRGKRSRSRGGRGGLLKVGYRM